MSDPRRLIDGSPDEFTAKLLNAALDDEPHPNALQRTAAALGVSGAISVATGTATAATSTAIVLKWLAIGGLAGLVTAGGASIARNDTPEGPRSTAEPKPVSPQPVAESPALPQRSTYREPKPVARRARVAAAPPSASAAPARTPTIAAEIETLDRARSALARGDPDAALATVDALERSGSTTFAPEAAVIRAESLFARGDRARAAEIARRFLEAHPASPHTARMRAITEK